MGFTTYQPSHQHLREADAKSAGNPPPCGPGAAARARRELEQAAREYQDFKLQQQAEARAATTAARATAAREAMAAASSKLAVEAAFRAAARDLRR